jgi:DNA-binding transcriptional ArsR family regulator
VDDATLDARLRALAHPVRRALLASCLVAPQPAGQLVQRSGGLAPASVSEHLKVLRKTGLLVLEKQGRFRVYRTDAAAVAATAEALLRFSRSRPPTSDLSASPQSDNERTIGD